MTLFNALIIGFTATASSMDLRPKHQHASTKGLRAGHGHVQRADPTPVVLVADGRSGSLATMTALSKLTGSCLPQGTEGNEDSGCWPELFGGRAKVALKIKEPKSLMASFLRQTRKTNRLSTLVGFQWKTFKNKYHKTRTPQYDEAWAYLGKEQIRALYYTRNPLDEFISRAKHSAQKDLPSTCASDDDECLRKMSAPFQVNATALPEFIDTYFLAQRAILHDMHKANVNFLKVSFEELVDNQDTDSRLHHWKRVLKFLKVNNVVDKKKIHKALDMKAERRGATVKNWKEVVHALHNRFGGEYAYLLTDRIEHLYGQSHPWHAH